MTSRLRLGDREFYTFEEAAEVLYPLYSERTLRRKTYSGELPHHGGKGRGRVCFSNDDLAQIKAASFTPGRINSQATAPAPVPAPENIVELPSFFRQTSRSKAIHAGKAAS